MQVLRMHKHCMHMACQEYNNNDALRLSAVISCAKVIRHVLQSTTIFVHDINVPP